MRGRTGVVSGNIVHDNGKHGIFFGGGSGGPDITNVLISNNIVYNNSKITPNSDGIRLDGAQVNMTQISITGNRCFDNQGTKTQRYGIILSGTKSGGAHDSILVGFNSLQGNKTGAFLQSSFTATNVSFWKNFGATNDNSLVPIDMASNKITSLANGTLATDAVNKGQLDSAGWSVVPASSTATGVVGQKAYDSTYLYVCTATNTWMRVAMSTW